MSFGFPDFSFGGGISLCKGLVVNLRSCDVGDCHPEDDMISPRAGECQDSLSFHQAAKMGCV